MKRGEGGGGEAQRLDGSVDAHRPKLGVLGSDRLVGWRLVEELACEVGGEGDEWDTGVGCGDRGELEEPSELGRTCRRRCADDDRRVRLHDESADGQGEALRVPRRDRARASDLPRVEGAVLEPVGGRHERENARVAARWFPFEHRRVVME